MKRTAWLLIGMLLIVGWTSYSIQAIKKTQVKANLKKGDVAPFAGILLTRPALAKIIAEYDGKIKKLRLDIQKASMDNIAEKASAKRICDARLSAEQTKAILAKTSCRRVMAIYEGALKKANRAPPWYTAPSLNQALGCAVCGGVCMGVSIAAFSGGK